MMNNCCENEAHENALVLLRGKLEGKKILQLGNLAGWPHTVAKGLRALGIDSQNILHEYRDVPGINRQLSFDSSIFRKDENIIGKVLKTLWFLICAPMRYKVIHYHSSNILPRGLLFLEAAYLRMFGVKTVISFGGGDARLLKEANEKNRYFYRKKGVLRDFLVKIRWMNWNRFVDACAADPEMLATKMNKIRKRVLFMQPIDFSRLDRRLPEDLRKPLRVLHVPTESDVKGTSIFVDVMTELADKYLIEFTIERNLPQDDFYKLLASTDVYLDELKCGSYGVTAAEAMSLGKVVVTYVREDLVSGYPEGMPIYNANPDNVLPRLDRLFSELDTVQELKKASFEYAERVHESTKILTKVLIPLYLELINEY